MSDIVLLGDWLSRWEISSFGCGLVSYRLRRLNWSLQASSRPLRSDHRSCARRCGSVVWPLLARRVPCCAAESRFLARDHQRGRRGVYRQSVARSSPKPLVRDPERAPALSLSFGIGGLKSSRFCHTLLVLSSSSSRWRRPSKYVERSCADRGPADR